MREDAYSNAFLTEMAHFEREMKKAKAEWEEKKETMEKGKIKWEWTDNDGYKWDGNYEGEVKDDAPHGLGKWKHDDGNFTVEGEWEDGLLNGRVVENYDDGDHF